jgi:hypothetical protein
MNGVDILRNNIIDKLFTITSKDYLTALYNVIQKSDFTHHNTTQLTAEQVLMLEMSEKDIINGDLITQEQVDLEDLKWLKEV